MAPDPKLVRDQFLAVAELPSAERAAYLAAQCGHDSELRAAVERLLAAHEQPAEILELTALADPAVTRVLLPSEQPGATLAGRYKLLEAIGEGGMGTVWVAEQTEPVRRKVALKLIKAGMDSKSVVARFEAERQALALMDHPHIAKVLDGGLTDSGRPFFVMEYVKGVPLTEYCDQARLSLAERLRLFIPICQAVQHAHQKGIIHRDLKPSNILVCLYDGKPVPKVIDFGLAKAIHQSLTDQTVYTAHGMMIGTPLYMSPEQAEPNNLDVDTRTDIYSLGVILYELLTGSTPLERQQLKEAAYNEILRLIKEVEPPKPSTRLSGSASLPSVAAQRNIEPKQLARSLTGDLDWIVMKALDKERSRRYETVNGLARDVERFLSDEAVEATPPSNVYRLRKFARKHRAALTTAAAFVALLVLGTTVSVWQAIRATKAELATRDAFVAEAKQRERAQQNELAAIDALKRFGDAVRSNPDLQQSSELAMLRKTLLTEPLAFFSSLRERLQADGETQSSSLLRLAAVAKELGEINDALGSKPNSVRAFEESRSIYERLVRDRPNDSELQRQLAVTHRRLGDLMRELGDSNKAFSAYQNSRAILERLRREQSAAAPRESDLAMVLINLGVLFVESGRSAESLVANEQAKEIWERLVEMNPEDVESHRFLAQSLHNIGVLLIESGRRDEALHVRTRVLAIRQRLAEQNPKVADLQSDLAGAYSALGSLLCRGDEAAGMKAYEQALSIRERLVSEFPGVADFQSELARDHDAIGDLLYGSGWPNEALAAYKRALEIQRKLADEHQSVTEFQSQLARTLHNIGLMHSETDQHDEALEFYKQALPIQERLVALEGDVTEFQSSVALTYTKMGWELKRDKPVEALMAFERAHKIHEELARQSPTTVQFQSDLASGLLTMGVMFRTVGEAKKSVTAFEQAFAIYERLVLAHRDSAEFQSGLGAAISNLSMFDLDARSFVAASDRLYQAIEHQKRALAINPNHPVYREYLANHYRNLLLAAEGLNDAKLAAEARRGRAELAASDPKFAALEQRLAAVLKGDPPASAAELLEFGYRAKDTFRFALAARFLGAAIERDPALAEDRQTQHAYNAACYGVLAAGSEALDDSASDSMSKVELRRQALAWLQAELDRWTKFLASAAPDQSRVVVERLTHWKTDSDLSGVRGDGIERLSESERQAWRALWAAVEEVRAQAAAKTRELP